MRNLTAILLFSLACFSCQRDKPLFDGQSCNGNCYILTGRLSEVQTNLPLPETELRFYFTPSGYRLFFDPTKYLGRAITAADGSYSFQFDSKDFESPSGHFRIEGSKNGYIYRNVGDKTDRVLLYLYLDSSKINMPQVNNLGLYKTATLKLRVKATTITNFQFLTISYGYGTNGYGPVLNGNRKIDTTLVYKTASDIPTYIYWSAKGDGVNIVMRDTLTVASGTEGIYDITL